MSEQDPSTLEDLLEDPTYPSLSFFQFATGYTPFNQEEADATSSYLHFKEELPLAKPEPATEATVSLEPEKESSRPDSLSICLESKLTTAVRNKLPDEAFGLPKKRKYPLIIGADKAESESHIKDAIRFFHFCKEPDRKELATNIVKAMRKLKMPITFAPKSTIQKYI